MNESPLYFSPDAIDTAWKDANVANGKFGDIALLEAVRNHKTGDEDEDATNAELDVLITKLREQFNFRCELAGVVMKHEFSPFNVSSRYYRAAQTETSYDPETNEAHRAKLFMAFDRVVPLASGAIGRINLIKSEKFISDISSTESLESQQSAFNSTSLSACQAEAWAAQCEISELLQSASDAPIRHADHKLIGEYLEQYKDNPKALLDARARVIATLHSLYEYDSSVTGLAPVGSGERYIRKPNTGGDPEADYANIDAIFAIYRRAQEHGVQATRPTNSTHNPNSRSGAYVKYTYTTPEGAYVRRTPGDDGYIIVPHTPSNDGNIYHQRQAITVKDDSPDARVSAGQQISTGPDDLVPFGIDYIGYTEDASYLAPQGDETARLAAREAGDFSPNSPTGPIDPNGDRPRFIPSRNSQ